MVMQYHWGLAPGHTYTQATANNSALSESQTLITTILSDLKGPELSSNKIRCSPEDEWNPDENDLELSFENQDNDVIDAEEDLKLDGQHMENNDEFVALSDMYGLDYD